jgi:hypothetical protein
MSSASYSKLSAAYGIDRRTLKRWRVLFGATLPSKPGWSLIAARFMPPLDASNYLLSMLNRFARGDRKNNAISYLSKSYLL